MGVPSRVTSLNRAVAVFELSPLLTAKPTQTVSGSVAKLSLRGVPKVAPPSADRLTVQSLPVRTSFSTVLPPVAEAERLPRPAFPAATRRE